MKVKIKNVNFYRFNAKQSLYIESTTIFSDTTIIPLFPQLSFHYLILLQVVSL